MKIWQKWVNWLARLCGAYGAYVAELEQERDRLKQEVEALRGFTIIYTDPTTRRRGYEQSAWYEPPERNTDPVQSSKATQKLEMMHFLELDDSRELPTVRPGDLTRKWNQQHPKRTG